MTERRSYIRKERSTFIVIGTVFFATIAGLLIGAEIQHETHFLGK